MPEREPVSYTHLDVYKRQVNEKAFLECVAGLEKTYEK